MTVSKTAKFFWSFVAAMEWLISDESFQQIQISYNPVLIWVNKLKSLLGQKARQFFHLVTCLNLTKL